MAFFSRRRADSEIDRGLSAPAKATDREPRQQILVQATYSDGSNRDVTELADFTSNDKEVAKVSETGLVRVGATQGEAAIVVRYTGLGRRLPDHGAVAAVACLFALHSLPENNFIDRLLYNRLKTLGVLPSQNCTDPEFLRPSLPRCHRRTADN